MTYSTSDLEVMKKVSLSLRQNFKKTNIMYMACTKDFYDTLVSTDLKMDAISKAITESYKRKYHD